MSKAKYHFGLLVAAVLSAVEAYASTPYTRIDLIPVKPTPAMESGVALESATFLAPGSYRFGLMGDFNSGLLALKLGERKLGDLIPYRGDVHLQAAFALHKRIEIGAALALTAAQFQRFELLENEGIVQKPPSFAGIGSLRVIPRFSILDPKRAWLGLALATEVRVPAPSAQSFMGDSGFVFAPRLLLERSFGPVNFLANAGYRFRPTPSQFLNLYVGHEFAMGLGALVDLPSPKAFDALQWITEMHLVTPTEAPFTFKEADSLKSPWQLLTGLRAQFASRWQAQLYFGRGVALESGYGREAFRALFSIAYQFQWADRDGDGIPDHLDGCPDVPEDKDGYQDSDGCPDPDNDNDGVLDGDDLCPLQPGSRELEGCPDRDGDGLADIVDKCPDVPGPIENEGCPVEGPEVQLESDRIRVNGQIQFETNEATIRSESYPMLDEVYKVLAENPQVGPVVIEGHTDNRGSRPYNLDLSKRRARAVEQYLVKKGIERTRLRSAGYGFDRPIANNATPLGRAKNRRTEFRLVTEAEAPAPTPEKNEGVDQKPKTKAKGTKKRR